MDGKLVLGSYEADNLLMETFDIPERMQWLTFLHVGELVQFVKELFETILAVNAGERTIQELSRFLDEWHETALLNHEQDVLQDLHEAEWELDSGGGKEWGVLKKELGL
jgi:hypothetical protein